MEFELIASKEGVTAKFIVTEVKVNTEDNTSTLKIEMFLKSSAWYGVSYFLDGTISYGSNEIKFNPEDDLCYGYIGKLNSYNQVKQSPFELIVPHNPDGTGPAMIEVDIVGTRRGSAGSGWAVTGTLEMPLTAIPRASTISATADVVFGGQCSVKWTPASASFKYKLGFSLEDWSHTTDLIVPNTTETLVYSGYTIPYEAAEQIPNEKSSGMRVVLYTYSGDNLVGEDDGYMVATLLEDEHTKPTVTIESITAVTALDSPLDELFIQGRSKAKVTFSGAGKHGANISGCSVTMGAVSQSAESPFTTPILNDYGTVSIVVTATDSRGFSASVTEQIEVLGYAKPKLVPVDGEESVVCARCNADGTVDAAGTALLIKAKKAYNSLDENNRCKLLLQYKAATDDDSAYSDPHELGSGDSFNGVFDAAVFDPTARYTIKLTAEDLVDSTSLTFTVMSDKIYAHRGEDFLALGGYTEKGGFESFWPAHFHGGVYIGDMTLADYIKSLL